MGLIITPTLQNVTEAQGGRNLAGDTRLEVEPGSALGSIPTSYATITS